MVADAGAADPAASVRAAVTGKIGLTSVNWPGIDYPLWVRAGTRDAAQLIEALCETTSRLRLPFAPRRILEIGAGAGYRSVALALAHPDATIVSVEPLPGKKRLHALNTLPWRQIVAVYTVMADTARRYGERANPETGRSVLMTDDSGSIPAIGLDDLYRRVGWDTADVLVIDPIACPDLATDPGAVLSLARLVAIVRHGPDTSVHETWCARFPEASHAHRTSDGFEMFFRREVQTPMAPPRRLRAFDCGGAKVAFESHEIADAAWRFFPIGDAGFRLHPNRPGAPPPRLVLRHFLAGPRRFETGLRLAHVEAHQVRFIVSLMAADGGRLILRADVVLDAGETRAWGFDLPLFFGEAKVQFSTEMADAADGNGSAWAEFLDPVFV